MEKGPIMVGPWGGDGGSPWDDGIYTAVRQVVVVHGTAIDSVRFEYDKKGSSVWSEKHGGNGGIKTDKVKIDHPREIITSIRGHYGPLSNGTAVIIRSLTFETNLSKYGPFGFEQGTFFSFPMSGGKIVGFHGTSGWYLDSIGFHLKQLQTNLTTPPKALIPSTSLTTFSDRNGYSYLDGNIGRGYDILLAVRERGEDNYTILTNNYSNGALQTSEYRDMNRQTRMLSFPSNTIERSGSLATGSAITYGSITGGAVTYGPWGGNGGTIFDDGIYTGVRQINLTRTTGISSLRVLYDRNGQSVWGNKNGLSAGLRPDKIVFDFPSEVLTHITGYFGTMMYMGPTVVRSLTFHTTKKIHGPYGDEQGVFFSSCLTEGKIIGFHGRSGWFIDGIGVHVLEGKFQKAPSVYPKGVSGMKITELSDSEKSTGKLVQTSRSVGEESQVTHGVVKEPVPIGPGPWGGDGGKPWDDGVYSGIKQICITRNNFINSIQIEYDRSGQSVWSTRHGGSGETFNRIKFEYPHEILNCISGYYNNNKDEGSKVLKSLTFFTNRGKYGPYGEESGTYFTSATTEGKVVGFHGRSGMFLDAIGVHMQHWLGDQKKTTKYMFSKYLF
ncbi:jacalin-related lectin 3 isoform X1 [Typha latifolia]|uniref:jacalin-related lectin 3 isoform X1 n=1 Tax=Typha latifolia TaxID=4733 RepID=UPI003C2D5B45